MATCLKLSERCQELTRQYSLKYVNHKDGSVSLLSKQSMCYQASICPYQKADVPVGCRGNRDIFCEIVLPIGGI